MHVRSGTAIATPPRDFSARAAACASVPSGSSTNCAPSASLRTWRASMPASRASFATRGPGENAPSTSPASNATISLGPACAASDSAASAAAASARSRGHGGEQNAMPSWSQPSVVVNCW
jgi:hypothetical protein